MSAECGGSSSEAHVRILTGGIVDVRLNTVRIRVCSISLYRTRKCLLVAVCQNLMSASCIDWGETGRVQDAMRLTGLY